MDSIIFTSRLLGRRSNFRLCFHFYFHVSINFSRDVYTGSKLVAVVTPYFWRKQTKWFQTRVWFASSHALLNPDHGWVHQLLFVVARFFVCLCSASLSVCLDSVLAICAMSICCLHVPFLCCVLQSSGWLPVKCPSVSCLLAFYLFIVRQFAAFLSFSCVSSIYWSSVCLSILCV